jgi:murein DD-endopeptidase MepM/ murein hydrolase activator NlpD
MFALAAINTGRYSRLLTGVCVLAAVLGAACLTAGSVRAGSVVELGAVFHEVERGETVFRISRDYGTEQAKLIAANSLNAPYVLSIGQRLRIPITRSFVVAAGNTLFSIAQDYGVPVASVAALNGIEPPFTILVGQVIEIPPHRQENTAVASSVATRPPGTSSQTSNDRPPGQLPPVPSPDGPGFIWPVEGRIVSSFGRKSDGRRNDGVNIAAPRGAPVRAAQSGVVAYADDTIPSLGNLVLIKHQSGVITAYAHNQAQLVARGDTVAKGQVIARVGSTGLAETPQLHFEIRRSGTAIDPEIFLVRR